jgi:hypothetical protein
MIAFTFVRKIIGRGRKIEVWRYTKGALDTGPVTVTADSLTSIQTIDVASGASGTVTRSSTSPKEIVIDDMGDETSGVVFLEGTDV